VLGGKGLVLPFRLLGTVGGEPALQPLKQREVVGAKHEDQTLTHPKVPEKT